MAVAQRLSGLRGKETAAEINAFEIGLDSRFKNLAAGSKDKDGKQGTAGVVIGTPGATEIGQFPGS